MKVRWAAPAEADLDRLVVHIAKDSVEAAIRMQDRLLEATADLAERPRRGRLGRIAKTRELVVPGTPYIAVYMVDPDTVWILHVVHGAQDWPPK
ncbi:MAG: type II toxin-antitoxin system RelE/ParE family toxin [Phenylobacterium sp.]